MRASGRNRFDDFFADGAYVALKNGLYNYRLRRRAVNRCLRGQGEGLTLEVGSGLSPMVTGSRQVVYSELSFRALRTLRQTQTRGFFVVADAGRLPFKGDSFQHIVCSEVIEHLPDDRQALGEMARVLKRAGCHILTFPHRRGYFARDDRFVNHLRRYELQEMEERLGEAGLDLVEVRKVLGPLEKAMMLLAVWVASISRKGKPVGGGKAEGPEVPRRGLWPVLVPLFGAFNLLLCLPVWLDARLSPRFLSTVLLTRSVKR